MEGLTTFWTNDQLKPTDEHEEQDYCRDSHWNGNVGQVRLGTEQNDRKEEGERDTDRAGDGLGLPSAEVRPIDRLCWRRVHVRGLTNEANRPRLHRGDERSRGSKMLREN